MTQPPPEVGARDVGGELDADLGGSGGTGERERAGGGALFARLAELVVGLGLCGGAVPQEERGVGIPPTPFL